VHVVERERRCFSLRRAASDVSRHSQMKAGLSLTMRYVCPDSSRLKLSAPQNRRSAAGSDRTSLAASADRTRLILEIDIRQLWSVVIADDEACVVFLDGPRPREVARGHPQLRKVRRNPPSLIALRAAPVGGCPQGGLQTCRFGKAEGALTLCVSDLLNLLC
jgi:hypothetical protein